MKIIKDNTTNIKEKIASKEIKCCYCNSILLITENDYHHGYRCCINDLGQPELIYCTKLVTCPCCNKEFQIY